MICVPGRSVNGISDLPWFWLILVDFVHFGPLLSIFVWFVIWCLTLSIMVDFGQPQSIWSIVVDFIHFGPSWSILTFSVQFGASWSILGEFVIRRFLYYPAIKSKSSQISISLHIVFWHHRSGWNRSFDIFGSFGMFCLWELHNLSNKMDHFKPSAYKKFNK